MTSLNHPSKYHGENPSDVPFPGGDALSIVTPDQIEAPAGAGTALMQGQPPASLSRPTDEEAQQAVRTLLLYAGEDPDRTGLRDTPARVTRAYQDWFSGYSHDPAAILSRSISGAGGHDQIVLLKRFPFTSFCECHMLPIRGTACIGYLPDQHIVGAGALPLLLDAFSRRLQAQHLMADQIARTMEEVLRPRGVGVILSGEHSCMDSPGHGKFGTGVVTSVMLGIFWDDPAARSEFIALSRL